MSLSILLVAEPRRLFGSERWDLVLDGVGIAIALAGQALRAMVIGLAYIKRGGEDGSIHANDLVVQGLFAHCRNPLYVGNMMEFTGLILVLNSPVGYLVGLPFFALAYYSIVLAEERFLRGKFGASFDDYCRRVNRFVPSFRGLRLTLASMQFDWKRVIRKEYGTTFVWVSTLLILLARQSHFFHGWPAARPTLRFLMVLWVGAVLAYAIMVLDHGRITLGSAGGITSIDNAAGGIYVPPLLRERHVTQFVLVTSRQHIARALRVFRKAGWDPVPSTPEAYADRWRPIDRFLPSKNALLASEQLFYGEGAFVYYWLRGWL
jgi:protein-S-isoprenylcysteine O-methyltransferase Ste14